jgi:hypothetical protein
MFFSERDVFVDTGVLLIILMISGDDATSSLSRRWWEGLRRPVPHKSLRQYKRRLEEKP